MALIFIIQLKKVIGVYEFNCVNVLNIFLQPNGVLTFYTKACHWFNQAIGEIKVVINFAINYTARVASLSNLVFKYLSLRTIRITFN